MRRLHLIILFAAVALSGMAQDISEAFYIYRNDGQFNAFLRDEVISIDYSYEDADGKRYDRIVTQIVNTADSVYKIPLAAIDSVGFVQPETIINSAVFPLTAEHSPFITNAEVLSFTMSGSTPDALRPKAGNIVVATAECTAFPDGIIARVESVKNADEGYQYTCSQAYYDEVFDQLITYMPTVKGNESHEVRSFDLRRASLDATLWDVNWSKTIEAGGTTTTLDVGDRATATITVRKTLSTPLYFHLQLQNDMTSSIGFNAKSTASTSKEMQIGKTITAGKITIPYTMGLLWLAPKLSLSGYFEAEGNVELNYSGHFNRTDKVAFTYTEGEWLFDHEPVTDLGTDVASLSMDGSAEIGLKPQIDFSLNGQQAGFGLSARAGLKESINFLFDATHLSDGGLYSAMRDSYCRTTIPWSVTVQANADIFSRYDAGQSDEDLTFTHTFAPESEPQWGEDRYIFPLFANVSAKRKDNDSNKAEASASVSRTPLIPVQVGFSLLDEDGNILQSKYDSRTYQEGNLFGSYTCDLTGLKTSDQYKVRPSVKLFGYDVLASPTAEIAAGESDYPCIDENHPHWVDLGLPSGTQWRCCNEGASTPEAYGIYFGEYDIKSDPHSAPTIDQIRELIDNCDYVYTTQHGVNGGRFIGPNGRSIFIPASGRLVNGTYMWLGDEGGSWSSTLNYAGHPFEFHFSKKSEPWDGYQSWQYGGLNPVRPVR